MKTLSISLAILLSLTLVSFTLYPENITQPNTESVSDYCDGWEDGYCEGYKDVKGQFAICPITPICPIAKLDCNEGYRCGYNRGFKAGMRKAR